MSVSEPFHNAHRCTFRRNFVEPTPEFRRRALHAAGPVFLFFLGALLLGVLLFWALFVELPRTLVVVLGASAVVAFAGALLWAMLQRSRDD